MTDLTPDFTEDDEWTPAKTPGHLTRQLRGPIRGAVRNDHMAAPPIVDGIPPNRAARRWYQRTVTKRSDRLHLVARGGWRKHDTRQIIQHRRELLSGANDPGDGLTRAERRADHREEYRIHRKNRRTRITS